MATRSRAAGKAADKTEAMTPAAEANGGANTEARAAAPAKRPRAPAKKKPASAAPTPETVVAEAGAASGNGSPAAGAAAGPGATAAAVAEGSDEAPSETVDDARREELVREAAYRRYEARGAQDGDALEDWLQAEAEVARRLGRPSASSSQRR